MRKRIFALLLAILTLTGALSGCGGSRQQTAPETPVEETAEPAAPETSAITVVDQVGREVTLEGPAEQVVSCYYLVTASLLTLGQKEKVVGIEIKADTRELYKLCAPEFLDLPGVGSGKETNIEAIAQLDPDVVLLPKRQKDAADMLTELGIPALVVDPETYEAYNEMIRMLGTVCGCEDAADDLVSYYDATVSEITALTADAERPAVYLGGDASYLRTCAGGMYQRQMIEMAGGTCVSAEIEGSSWADVSAEQLLAWDPAVIFAVQYADYTLDDLRADPALGAVTAVAEDALYTVPSPIEAWDYPQPSSILGLLWMTHILHPELVSQEQYLEKAQEFYSQYFDLEVTPAQLGIQ